MFPDGTVILEKSSQMIINHKSIIADNQETSRLKKLITLKSERYL